MKKTRETDDKVALEDLDLWSDRDAYEVIIQVCFCSWCYEVIVPIVPSILGVHLVSELVVVGYALWTCNLCSDLKFLVSM